VEEEHMSSEQHLRELEEKYEDYKVYDRNGERIGKVDDLFIDERDREEYIGVKMGFFGLKSTLIPMEVVRVNEADRRIEVSETKDLVKDAPTFSDDDEIDESFEESIRRHFNLESGSSEGRGSYSAYAGSGAASGTHSGDDHDAGEQSGRPLSGSRDEGSPGIEDTRYERGTSSDTTSAGQETYSDTEGSRGTGEQVGASGSTEYRDTDDTQHEGDQGVSSSAAGEYGDDEQAQEGGRPKVRRRIIREEIIEEDPQDAQR
jgi:hypothetical protein